MGSEKVDHITTTKRVVVGRLCLAHGRNGAGHQPVIFWRVNLPEVFPESPGIWRLWSHKSGSPPRLPAIASYFYLVHGLLAGPGNAGDPFDPAAQLRSCSTTTVLRLHSHPVQAL